MHLAKHKIFATSVEVATNWGATSRVVNFNSRPGLLHTIIWAEFHRAASAQKLAKHNKIMLSRIRLPAKLPYHMYNL